ncbi:MAG: hypothetical protein FD177_924 [Desulfovibrionaceae bacterium]|nr:MAG: hypothetical protein FD177_924 [Desulfovibrionaceae bacterium]
MHATEKKVEDIKSRIEEANTGLATTRAAIKEKSAALAALREDLKRQLKPHVGSNKLPSGVRVGQEKVGVLTGDIDLLNDLADEYVGTIKELQADLADAIRAHGQFLARQRTDGLRAVHGELVNALADIHATVAARVQDELLPIFERLRACHPDTVARDLGCPTMLQAYTQHREVMSALAATYHALPFLKCDIGTLEDLMKSANNFANTCDNMLMLASSTSRNTVFYG